jgi:NADPH:quinone reductase-like Zn-dependent oxidoreductase
MQAVVMHTFGEPEVLQHETVSVPAPMMGEVLVRVGAAFVAFGRDVGTRSGLNPIFPRLITLPHVLGGECSGTVVAVGYGVDAGLLGTRVTMAAPTQCGVCDACRASSPWDCQAITLIGIHRQGSYAAYCVSPATNVRPLPEWASYAEGAALAANGPLALEELSVTNTQPGDWVLVPGASGSVGTLVVALAALKGARVIALTRGGRAASLLRTLGAEVVLDTDAPSLTADLLALTGHGVDVVVDNVALLGLWERYWPAVAQRGRIAFAGRASGDRQPLPVDVGELYSRRATLAGVALGDPRYVDKFWQMLRSAPLSLPESAIHVFPLHEAAAAHARIEDGDKVGHFVLTAA